MGTAHMAPAAPEAAMRAAGRSGSQPHHHATGSPAATAPATPITPQSRIFLLRLSSAIAGAGAFGLIAAPLSGLPYLPAAFVLAFGFGVVFVGGTGYRIVLAVALRDGAQPAAASWSGATAVSALAALALAASGRDMSLVLAAYAVAINLAYVPVKLACLGAGCCTATRSAVPPSVRSPDLRLTEIGLTVAVLATAAAFLGAGAPAHAAAFGLCGHLMIRLLSRWARGRLPRHVLSPYGRGQEIAPLTLAASWALALSGG